MSSTTTTTTTTSNQQSSSHTKTGLTQFKHPLAITKTMLKYKAGNEPFELLARYEAQAPIAKGSYGYVACAIDTEAPKQPDDDGNLTRPKLVAIKKVKSLFDSQRLWVCAHRELSMMLHFNHRNVMPALDIFIPLGEHNNLTSATIEYRKQHFDEIYIVMDKMDCTLRDWIDSQPTNSETGEKIVMLEKDKKTGLDRELHPCKFDYRCYFFFQLLCGMGYIHKCGVMHRDMKPENVLVDFDWTTRICDFGQGRGVGGLELVTTNVFNCTLWYAAPETLTDQGQPIASITKNLFHAADVWSIGCIAAEMLIGKPIFETMPFSVPGQLETIVSILGTPSESDIAAIGRTEDGMKQVKEGLRELMKTSGLSENHPSSLHAILKSGLGADEDSSEEVDMICKMLRYNPAERMTIEEALQLPLFEAYQPAEGDEPLLGNPVTFPFVPKEKLATSQDARDEIWNFYVKRHPEVNELIDALKVSEAHIKETTGLEPAMTMDDLASSSNNGSPKELPSSGSPKDIKKE